jgi:sugar phosphate permease
MLALLIRSFGQGMLIVPIVLSVTSGIRKDDQGIAAGLYNMSQQLGGALGLATVATIASAAATGVGGGVLGEAHGIRIGFLVALGLALVGGVIAMVWLQTPDQNAVIVEVAAGADSPHSIDDESPPLPLDLATPTASAISDTTDTSA